MKQVLIYLEYCPKLPYQNDNMDDKMNKILFVIWFVFCLMVITGCTVSITLVYMSSQQEEKVINEEKDIANVPEKEI